MRYVPSATGFALDGITTGTSHELAAIFGFDATAVLPATLTLYESASATAAAIFAGVVLLASYVTTACFCS